MTELFVFVATAIAGILFVDPFYGGALVKTPFAKVIVLVLGSGALGFHLLGRAVVAPERFARATREVFADWWPLIVLSLFIILGSAFARFAEDIKESFLAMGLGMLFLPAVAVAVRSDANPMLFMKSLAVIYVLMAVSMLGILVPTDHLFHESIFVVVPLGGYFLTARPLRAWQVVLGLTLVGLCAFSFKNTTFLMMLTTLAACALVGIVRIAKQQSTLRATAWIYFIVVVLVVCAAGLFYAWLNYRTKLPTGNVDYRTEMYGIAWRRFLSSPIWGTGFTESSVNYFTLYKVEVATQELPTHSDILDILAHGGLIGLALWLAVVWRILSISWAAVVELASPVQRGGARAWRWLFLLALMQIDAIVTYAVNPPLISPVHGFWIWGSAGLMWALHRQLTQASPAEVAQGDRLRSPALA